MQKDFKIGMMVGTVVLLGAVLWLSTRSGIGTQARLERTHSQLLAQRREQSNILTPAPPPAEANTPVSVLSSPTAASQPTLPTSIDSLELSALQDAPVETRQKIQTNRLHIVRAGETLSEIAQDYLGSSRHWPRLLEANRKTLTDPDKIRPGMKLVVPRE